MTIPVSRVLGTSKWRGHSLGSSRIGAVVNLTRYTGCAGSFLRLVQVNDIATFQTALNNAQPGDRIHLLGAAGGGPANGLYVVPEGTTGPTANVDGTEANRIVICGDPADPVTIQQRAANPSKFQINASYTSLYGVNFLGSTNNDVVIFLFGAEFVEVIGCDISQGSGNAGISSDDIQGGVIAYNFIHNEGVGTIQHGMYWRANNVIGSGAVRNYIVGNLIAFTGGRGITMHDNAADPLYNNTVAHNSIVGCSQEGLLIECSEGTGNVIANNLLTMNRQNSSGRQMRFNTGREILIYNNIRYHTDAAKRGLQDGSSLFPGYSAADYTESGNVDASDPLLTSLSMSGAPGRGSSDTGDFHLLAGSPAIGLGLQAYSISPDYDNVPYTGSADAGGLLR